MAIVTLDFETEAIVGNPIVDPPEPVGAALYVEGHEPVYYPIGENFCRYLYELWDNPAVEFLFHNAPFDLSVARDHLGLDMLPWNRIHDTQYLIYLADPYADTLSLKPSAERFLSLPPEEQDELKAWVLQNVPEATARNWGAYIARAPFSLVSKYAIGDVVRTRQLFDKLRPTVPQAPYDRERQLMPLLYNSTLRGVRIDRARLEQDVEMYGAELVKSGDMIREYLGAPGLNIGSPDQLADALERAEAVTKWTYTKTGRRSTAKKAMLDNISDPHLANLLQYHSSLDTCLGTFMLPWLAKSENDGRLHPNWNQVRSTEGKRKGTRTGRLSSDDTNFQNVPTYFSFPTPDTLHPLPHMRQYVLPEEGHIWLKRDFSSQEIRILAHYEDGMLCQAYVTDPMLDPHAMAQQIMLSKTGRQFPRKDDKITAFLMVYGGGLRALSAQLHQPVELATQIRNAYLEAIPGVKLLQTETKMVGRLDQPITTWGGRKYYKEPSKIINGQMRSFEYKLLNYLIQGSAADQTKQCLIDWDSEKLNGDVFMATVHDEINISAPAEDAHAAMQHLKAVMEQPLFDVPFRSEGFMGPNWHDMTETD
jgi:DNA polymerase I-like protein with 3'-5' exonuclease and polymerase domains